MSNNTLDQLLAMRVFIRIVEAGSFVKAADSLNIPKPTVTKLLQNLESHLGVKLLQRTTRTLTVTLEGVQYFEQAKHFIAELEEFDTRIRLHKATPKGRLRVDTSSALANLILIPALPTFYARYPDIQLVLGVSDQTVDLIAEGADCAIRGGELSDTSLVARRITELDFITCASPNYLEKYGIPTHPSELENNHQIVGYFSAANYRHRTLLFNRDTENIEIKITPSISANESSAHLSALVAGLGIGQIPRLIAQSYINKGGLLPLLTDWKRARQPVHMIYPSSRHLNSRLRVFLDWVVDLFTQLEIK